MNKIKNLFFCLAAAILLAACQQAPTTTSQIKLTDSQGKQYALADLQNKVIVLNYWAPWCKPCHEEIPELNAFAKKYADKALVLGVDFDESTGTDLQAKITNMNITFPVLASNPAIQFHIQEVEGLPVTFIISPSGKVLKTLYGKQTEQSLLEAIS